MRRHCLALLATAAFVGLPSGVRAQVNVGPYVAFHDDFDFGLGGYVQVGLPQVYENVSFVGDLGIFFPDEGSPGVDLNYFEINLDLLYDFAIEDPVFTPWVFGGLNIAHASAGRRLGVGDERGGSNTDLGLNIGGGATFGTGSIRPYVGAKVEAGGGNGFVIFGGVGFDLGGGGSS